MSLEHPVIVLLADQRQGVKTDRGANTRSTDHDREILWYVRASPNKVRSLCYLVLPITSSLFLGYW